MLKKILSMLLVLMMITTLLIGCSGNSNKEADNNNSQVESSNSNDKKEEPEELKEKEEPKEVVIGIAGDAYSLDPYPRNETITNGINLHIFDTIVEMSSNLEIVPALAVSWEANEDATIWTFKLREGVSFHNGNIFDADDVIYSYERAKSDMSAFDGMLSTVESMKKIDSYTVELTLNQSNVLLLSQVKDVMILDKETCEGLSDEEIALVPNGTGRYILEEHLREDRIVFVRNDNYWGELPEATKVTFKPISNEGTRTANILSGAVDLITDVPVRDTEIIGTNKAIKILTNPSLRNIYINLNGWSENPSVDAEKQLTSPDGSNPFMDIRVREAIYRAIDEDMIIKQIMNGYAIAATTYIPEGYNGYNPDIKRFDFDSEKAKKLLDEAGYVVQDDGYRFEMTLDASNDRYVNDADIAIAIAGYLEKVNIKVNLNLMSRTVFFSYISSGNKAGDNTHFMMTGWADGGGESTLMGMDMIYSNSQSGATKEGFGGVNRGYYTNDKVDVLIDEAMGTIDSEKRDELMKEAWQIAADDISYIPLHFQVDVYAIDDKISYKPRFNKYVFAWDITFN